MRGGAWRLHDANGIEPRLRSRGDTRGGNGVATRKVGCCNTAGVEPRGPVSVVDTSPFGRGLRHWRRIRGVSQLELASTAQTTTRHVSFLETGRSRPSPEMVDRLGDALTIPLRERNRLLAMAGLPPGYVEGDLESHDLAPFQAVIDRLLAAHDPYPGFVLDRHWNIIQTNRGSELFLATFDARNIIELALGAWRPLIENWPPVAGALKERLAADLLRFPDDRVLEAHHNPHHHHRRPVRVRRRYHPRRDPRRAHLPRGRHLRTILPRPTGPSIGRGRKRLSDGHDGSWPVRRRARTGLWSVSVSAAR